MTEQEIIIEFKKFLTELSNSNSIKHNYSNEKGFVRRELFTRFFAEKIKFFDKEISKKGSELIKLTNKDIDKEKLKTKFYNLSKEMINTFKTKNQ